MLVRMIRQRRIVSRTNPITKILILDTPETSGDRIYQNAQRVLIYYTYKVFETLQENFNRKQNI